MQKLGSVDCDITPFRLACFLYGQFSIRPPLKKSLFPVQRLGENICADWDLFSFFLIFDFSFFHFF